MAENSLKGLRDLGQSVWLDYISRGLIKSGGLHRLVEEEGVTGVTSNPSIFQKAISEGGEYSEMLRALLEKGMREEKELFISLAVKDISEAAEILKPVYDSTGGRDGFVSIEVSPEVAHDTEKTVEEARRLYSEIGRENVLIKVPATKEGIPAIKTLTEEGINVNATLLFSVERYEEAAWAYISGLEGRLKAEMPINKTASVASFFVSRVDTSVDRALRERLSLEKSGDEKQRLASLVGKAAAANAKAAYRKFREIFSSARFDLLREKGGCVQRLLWASTGTKDPSFSDIKYVEEIIGPDTVNTMPENTMTAFKDHGTARITVEDGIEDALSLFGELASLGISMDEVTSRLEEEGVRLFSESYFELLKDISAKRDSLLNK